MRARNLWFGSFCFLLWILSAVSGFAPSPSTTSARGPSALRLGAASEVVINEWLRNFSRGLYDKEYSISDLFIEDGTAFWRDMVAFSWNIITLEGRDAIGRFVAFLREQDPSQTVWTLDTHHKIVTEGDSLEFCALIDTPVGRGRAHVRLQRSSGKAITLLTTLSDLHERPFFVAPDHRAVVSVRQPVPLRKYWHEQYDDDPPYVIIVGAGQAGLSLGARLQALRIPYVILEAGDSPGEAWRQRYPSLCLHDPVYYNHLPYLHFPPTWPLFCPRDKIARWMEFYAEALDLRVQTSVRVTSAKKVDEGWEVMVNGCSGAPDKLVAKHLVLATGNSSHAKRLPRIPGSFRGLQIHSSKYEGGRHYQQYKNFLVVGSNTSAMDIVQDLWEQLHGEKDVQITLLQRSPSTVVSTDSVLRIGLGPLWSETSDPEEADWRATTVPYRMALSKWTAATKRMRANDDKLLKGLTKAGFQLDFGPGDTGIFAKSASEGGGFYIDVGAATLIAQGEIAVRYATLQRLEGDTAVLDRIGTKEEERVKADCIIYATGFGTLDKWVDEICGNDVARALGRTWGIGYGYNIFKDPSPWEGELRNMWKPTNVDGLWFQGGNLAQNRHYSIFLALQLAARYVGQKPRVYGVPKPTPLGAD